MTLFTQVFPFATLPIDIFTSPSDSSFKPYKIEALTYMALLQVITNSTALSVTHSLSVVCRHRSSAVSSFKFEL